MSILDKLSVKGMNIFIIQMTQVPEMLMVRFPFKGVPQDPLFDRNNIYITTSSPKADTLFFCNSLFKISMEDNTFKVESKKDRTGDPSDAIALLLKIMKGEISPAEALTNPNPVIRVFFEFWNSQLVS